MVDKDKKNIEFEIVEGDMGVFDPGVGTIARGNAVCPICEQVTEVKKIRLLAQNGQMGQRLVVVVLHNPRTTGKTYRIATEKDIQAFNEAKQYLQNKIESWRWLDSPLPDEQLPPIGTLGFRVQRYGMIKWQDIFNSRQKLALITFMEKIKRAEGAQHHNCRRGLGTAYHHRLFCLPCSQFCTPSRRVRVLCEERCEDYLYHDTQLEPWHGGQTEKSSDD